MAVIRLTTQRARARFVRKEIRKQGLSIDQVADEAGLCWSTVNNFAQEFTRWPRMETVVRIFYVLGYDVVFTVSQEARKGVVNVGSMAA